MAGLREKAERTLKTSAAFEAFSGLTGREIAGGGMEG